MKFRTILVCMGTYVLVTPFSKGRGGGAPVMHPRSVVPGCKCARMRFHCANGLVVAHLRIVAHLRGSIALNHEQLAIALIAMSPYSVTLPSQPTKHQTWTTRIFQLFPLDYLKLKILNFPYVIRL